MTCYIRKWLAACGERGCRLIAHPNISAMKIHEYQAKAILAQYGVPVPRGEVARTPDEAEAAAKKVGGTAVVKAQIHAGGRGKGGGVKIAKDTSEAAEIASKMLGMRLVTHQTGPDGRIVHRVLIEETLPIERELYLGIVLDRNVGKPVFMASAAGGSPANFLDVGGGASADQIKNAFRILLSDHSVRAVLINIFGGILRCDTLATGVVAAALELKIRVPVVVRMEGTNVEAGRQILTDSGLDFTVAQGMKDAAEKVVRLAQ